MILIIIIMLWLITDKWQIFLLHVYIYILKMLGWFNPTLGQIWTNPTIGLIFFIIIIFSTQSLGLSIYLTQNCVKTTKHF